MFFASSKGTFQKRINALSEETPLRPARLDDPATQSLETFGLDPESVGGGVGEEVTGGVMVFGEEVTEGVIVFEEDVGGGEGVMEGAMPSKLRVVTS